MLIAGDLFMYYNILSIMNTEFMEAMLVNDMVSSEISANSL